MSRFKVGDKVVPVSYYMVESGIVTELDEDGDIRIRDSQGKENSHYAKFFVLESVHNSELYQLLHKEEK